MLSPKFSWLYSGREESLHKIPILDQHLCRGNCRATELPKQMLPPLVKLTTFCSQTNTLHLSSTVVNGLFHI